MTARREFGGAIGLCVLAAGLVLLGLRQDWGRVFYKAPAPLPSGSLSVTGQAVIPAASALALAALACLAAVIATRGLARRLAGLVLAGLGVWMFQVLANSVSVASVVNAASSGQPGSGSVPGNNSAISGNTSSGGLPLIGSVSHVVWGSTAWRPAAMAATVVVIIVGLVTVWRGQRWPVMSARFDRPGKRRAEADPEPASAAPSHATVRGDAPGDAAEPDPGEPRVGYPDSDAAALWEALDRGEDLTEADTAAEPVTARRDES